MEHYENVTFTRQKNNRIQDLIEGFKKGDRRVIEKLYQQLFPTLKHWVETNSGTEADAEDLFQEAMVATYRTFQDPQFTLKHELTTYIFAVVKKMWLQRIRHEKVKAKYQTWLAHEEESTPLDQLIYNHEVQELYLHYFKQLSQECQQLLKFVFDGKSMSEIRDLFKYSNEAQSRKKKFRCKNMLINMIKKDSRYQELTEH